ncbi:DUF2852 domain-containing protein [Paracoccus sp. P2]|uniref:DUF2852 domain-containing protein n=1 Tax=Paracoccus pantotrophus TaxID=82367 RepID=A0A1I5FIE3_PARPN|nr:DUF2852 domain-containing protein [Paracoccus pantotrophus]MDF3853637.1 DUF2852 domain-containing protein [Paracoccus pantotrophus]QFG35920.1 DUF2852 domain-containing protein [Paracoccus pantotrophus]QLH12799.1 DUF2852 domain-containing protein [Paracoccus pantotrophus]RDD97330.1 DUF2852 domain-containing protein [Paracoccus pantotrophus]RKS43814.1 uncharacterized protein DUF2852 [Paracoccus pantotrophus]
MNTDIAPRPSVLDRIGAVLAGIRDWLDERGKGAWIAAMILAFIACWPLGLAILGYMIWSKRMFSCRHRHHHHRHGHSHGRGYAAPTGNTAFDAYREETLKRLEDEHREFLDFLQKLREAKDKAEFDQFMQSRKEPDQPQAARIEPQA